MPSTHIRGCLAGRVSAGAPRRPVRFVGGVVLLWRGGAVASRRCRCACCRARRGSLARLAALAVRLRGVVGRGAGRTGGGLAARCHCAGGRGRAGGVRARVLVCWARIRAGEGRRSRAAVRGAEGGEGVRSRRSERPGESSPSPWTLIRIRLPRHPPPAALASTRSHSRPRVSAPGRRSGISPTDPVSTLAQKSWTSARVQAGGRSERGLNRVCRSPPSCPRSPIAERAETAPARYLM